MTAKRKDTGDEFEIKVGNKTVSWRVALVVLIFSATPTGQSVMKSLGVNTPTDSTVEQLRRDFGDMRADIGKLNGDIAEIKTALRNHSISQN